MPARIVCPIARHRYLFRAIPQRLNAIERAAHLVFPAYDANQVLHHVLQIVLHLIRALGAATLERLKRFLRDPIHFALIDPTRAILLRKLRRVLTGALAEHQKIRKRIAAQPVRAM